MVVSTQLPICQQIIDIYSYIREYKISIHVFKLFKIMVDLFDYKYCVPSYKHIYITQSNYRQKTALDCHQQFNLIYMRTFSKLYVGFLHANNTEQQQYCRNNNNKRKTQQKDLYFQQLERMNTKQTRQLTDGWKYIDHFQTKI